MDCFLIVCLITQAFCTAIAFGQTTLPDGAQLVVSVNEGDGKVQVFHEGTWTYLCGHRWNNQDAQVVCRMEGYWHGEGSAHLQPAGPDDVILLDDVNCTGTEDNIGQCGYRGLDRQPCNIHQVASVNCQSYDLVQVRLVEGYGGWEGRLEVQSGGGEGGGGGGDSWRPVCHHGFHDLDAQVVCRMLGIRTEGGKAHAEEKFPQSNLPPLIHQLDCTGHETSIAQCKGKRAGAGENCTNVGVECYNCGGMYTNSTGTVQTENYPLSYPGNLDCLYVIQPANQQQLYKLDFANFSTEACCDSLEVQVLTPDGVLSGGQKYAGTSSPPRFLGKVFALSFLSDGTHAGQGFQATWSTARVQDVTSVKCEAGHFTVDIDLDFLRRLYPASSPLTIGLADPACRGVVIPGADQRGDHLVIRSETDDCGTRIETRDDVIVYHNFVVDRVFAEDSAMIVRGRRWEIPVLCQVVRSDSFQVHYIPFSDVRRRRETAHARDRREVRGSLTVDMDFPITIRAYRDRTFTTLDSTPLTRRLGDDIDLRVAMSGGDLDLKVVLQNCSTLPEPGSGDITYTIIRDGCAVDSKTEVLGTRQHGTDFRFTAFEFAGDFPQVYVTCDVRVCPANENSAECSQQCGSSVPLIRKRANPESIIIRETKPAAATATGSGLYSVAFGPIVLEK